MTSEAGTQESRRPGVRTWLPDPSHYLEQMTPLSATTWFDAMGMGLHDAMRELKGPFGGFDARTQLGWAYEGDLPLDWEVDPDALMDAALSVGSTWSDMICPRVHEISAELHSIHLEGSTPEQAVRDLDRAWRLIQEQWRLHFLAVIPAQFAIEELTDRYAKHFGNDDPLGAYRLLDGEPNESVEADDQLAALAALAVELHLDAALTSIPAADVRTKLRQWHHGRRWLHELDKYLLRFGCRSRWHELSLPREIEEPTLTLESVRLFLESPAQRVRPAAERRARAAELLVDAPEVAEILDAARAAYALKESHVYHIDYPGLLAAREVLLGAGHRLVAQGTLTGVDDVWLLRRDELRALILDDLAVDVEQTLISRRSELAEGRLEGVRPYLGEAPGVAESHPVLTKFYGPAHVSGSAQQVRGSGASPGIGEGPARLVWSLDDFERVRPGDVLFALTTTPAWTPLFPSLSALVTETGGVLCHAAIVAREYGIPAVVGATSAMQRVADGTLVRVDGSAGTVEVL